MINFIMNNLTNYFQIFIANELLHSIILLGGFSYAIGVIFLPLLVQDILIGAMPDKWSYRIWRMQFWPIVNCVLFITIFAYIIFKMLWWPVKRIMWNIIYMVDYENYYKEIIVPKKYKLPKKFKEDNNVRE